MRRVVIRIRHWPGLGQERADLVVLAGVVEDHDGAAAAQLGPEQGRTFTERVG